MLRLCLGRHDLPRARWQLQHGGVLASGQFRHQDDLTIRQFQSIMVDVTLLFIDLAKAGHLVWEPFVTEALGGLALKILFKGKLRAR